MPERLNGTVSKTVEGATPPRVRIPLSPPLDETAGLRESGPALMIKGGDVAQLGEHLVRNEGVVGSNPIISTICTRYRAGPA